MAVAETQAPALVRGQDEEENRRRRKRAKRRGGKAKTAKETREVHFRAYLREAEVSRAGRAYECTLLREGPGNAQDRNWYTREALRKAVSDGLFEGAQCYADHPSASEERDRPERSVRQLVGQFREARFVDGQVAEVRAKFIPIDGEGYEWVRSLVESALGAPEDRPLVGLSIDGYGHDDGAKEHNGQRYALVREIAQLGSVDLVTRAGAGGQFIRRLTESLAGAAAVSAEALDARGMRKRVRKALKRLEEATDGDTDKLSEVVVLLREVSQAKVAKPTKLREAAPPPSAPGDAEREKLESRARKADKRRQIAESEAASLKLANHARRLLTEAAVPPDLARVWFDELAEQPTKARQARVLERLQTERQSALVEVRESLGFDRVEGAGPRTPEPTAPAGPSLLARLGIDRDDLEAA